VVLAALLQYLKGRKYHVVSLQHFTSTGPRQSGLVNNDLANTGGFSRPFTYHLQEGRGTTALPTQYVNGFTLEKSPVAHASLQVPSGIPSLFYLSLAGLKQCGPSQL